MTDCLYPHNDDRSAHEARRGFLCESGYRRLEQHLAELVALDHWLHANLGRSGNSGFGDYTTGSKDRPLPIKDGIADHEALILFTVNSWARMIAEDRDLKGPWKPLAWDGREERDRLRRAVEQTASLEDLTGFLLAHLPWSAEQLWIDDYATEVDDLTRKAHGLAPSQPQLYRMPAPCFECEALELHRRDGDGHISCGSCGRMWTEDEYAWLALILADEIRRSSDLPEWTPVNEIADRFDLNPATIRKWEQRGMLESRRDGKLLLIRLVCDVPRDEQGVA